MTRTWYSCLLYTSEYAINRYAMETKRLLDVADKRLAVSRYLAGDELTIADFAAFPWLGGLSLGLSYACLLYTSRCV